MPSDSAGTTSRSRTRKPSAGGNRATKTKRSAGSSKRSGPAREPDWIEVRGAAEHNLKIDQLRVPKRELVVFTGVSGSGKSSLAFDTLYAEGQRRYVESLSTYARQFLDQLTRPDVESIDGLSPAVAIEQKSVGRSQVLLVGNF
jgi:excinuclease ABC subunit A